MNISDYVKMTSFLPTFTLSLLGCGFLLFLVILGVIANITVCTVMMQGHRFKKHLSNFMLFHLSITDIVYRLIVVPGQLIASLLPIQNKNVLICKVTKTLLFSVHTAVFTSLVVIALDRHQSITKPFQRMGRKPRFYLYVMVVWGFSILIASPQMYSEGISPGWNVTYPNNGVNITYTWQVCLPSKGSTQEILASLYFILGFLVPLVIITVAYSKIALYLWRKSRKNRATNQAALKSKGKALQMLVLLVLGFVVCLGVPQVKNLMNSFGFQDVLVFTLLVYVLQLSSSVVNTVIYGIYSAEFKQGLKKRKKPY